MLISPENCAVPPISGSAHGRDAGGPPHDLLSQLLHSVRLGGERVAVHAPPPPFSVDFTGVGGLHMVEAGELLLRVDGEPEQIGRALSVVHRSPGHDGTVEDLARTGTLSRSTFAARFVAQVGMPPATDVAHVRLDAATDLLRATSLPVAAIATTVGYASEAAFSRAFKSRYGMPPARWRRDGHAPRT